MLLQNTKRLNKKIGLNVDKSRMKHVSAKMTILGVIHLKLSFQNKELSMKFDDMLSMSTQDTSEKVKVTPNPPKKTCCKSLVTGISEHTQKPPANYTSQFRGKKKRSCTCTLSMTSNSDKDMCQEFTLDITELKLKVSCPTGRNPGVSTISKWWFFWCSWKSTTSDWFIW